jgi:predicted RNA polymerase sigma factor
VEYDAAIALTENEVERRFLRRRRQANAGSGPIAGA